MKKRTICLSFDFEECDLPRESGVDFPIEKGMEVSHAGAEIVLDILKRQGVRATIFCTLNFAERAPDIIRRILDEGHELAAHGVDHWHQDETDPRRCKEGLERLTGRTVVGYRQPRMFPVSDAELKAQGYAYNSSLNPAFVPGRYAHRTRPRRPFVKEGLLQIPASVVPVIRFPLFWLALHLLPEGFYRMLVRLTLAWDGRFVTYFHPWEFYPGLGDHPEWKIPGMIRRHAGRPLAERLARFIAAFKASGAEFRTLAEEAEELNGQH